MDEKFFTTDQVAKILQVHPFTILKYIRNGKLKGIKLGRVYRVKESDINEFIEQQSTQPKKKQESKKKTQSQKSEQPRKEKVQKDENGSKEEDKTFDLDITEKTKTPEPPETPKSQKKVTGEHEPDHYYII